LIYVLDACAIIAFFDGEIGADIVEQALLDANSQCLAHAINLCEVFYGFYRVGGETYSRQVIGILPKWE
jgi:PIN domain nuclease of toxin-antitoxin system